MMPSFEAYWGTMRDGLNRFLRSATLAHEVRVPADGIVIDLTTSAVDYTSDFVPFVGRQVWIRALDQDLSLAGRMFTSLAENYLIRTTDASNAHPFVIESCDRIFMATAASGGRALVMANPARVALALRG